MHTSKQSAIDAVLQDGWVQSVDWQAEVDSTNLVAKRAISSGQEMPALFVADSQTAGRGRSSNQWWSPAGCLMLTLAVDETLAPESPTTRPLLALLCGIAVADTIRQWFPDEKGLAPRVQLKWPNDVYLDGSKVCGILIESLASPSGSTVWLIGIGVNVDMDWATAPDEVKRKATCMTRSLGQVITREAVLVQLIDSVQQWVERWRDGYAWTDCWNERCLLSGKVVRARSPASQIVGRCEGVDSLGHLLVRDDQQLHQITAAEILDWQR
ncbi:MAG: hypothetical protein Aurels2KO_08670 [Aureliella sp.]